MSTTENTQNVTSTETTTTTETNSTMSSTERRTYATTETESDRSGNNGDNFGLVDRADVFGDQFLTNNLNVENDSLDARHAFLLKPEDANDGGRLLQLFSGIENEVTEFYGYNIRQWQDKSHPGHELPEGAQSYYVAWRRTDPADILTTTTLDNAFPEEMITATEFMYQDENDNLQVDISDELLSLEEYIWNIAETEDDVMAVLDAFDSLADEDATSTSMKTIQPPENPDTEAELTQSKAAFFWGHLVGKEVLKCELTENGVYAPVETVQYEWTDQTNPDAGVHRVK